MTQRREWPNGSKEARDRAAEEAMRGLKNLRVLMSDGQPSNTEVYRRVAVAIDCFQNIARLLEAEGAQTRP